MSTVFGSYTQAELDAQYDQGSLVADREPFYRRWRETAAKVRARCTIREAVPYGVDPAQTLDVFPAIGSSRTAGTVHVHYHGGAWRALSSRDAWFIAEPWLAAGHSFVSVNFGLVPDISLARQVDQARHALTWCRDNAKALNVESGRLSVSGHSSGGHLAAMAALAVWEGGAALDPFIDGVIIASGSYDLEPVRLSARNRYLKLGVAEGQALSPIAHLKQNPPPCTVIWSRRELPEFQRQSAQMAEALGSRGHVRRIESDVATHFDTWELITPDALVGQVDAAGRNRDA